MMSNEVWAIELGQSIGPLRLGATFAEVFHVLKSRTPLRPFEIVYDGEFVYERGIVVISPEDGFRLHFDPVRQMLQLIEFYDLHRIALRFGRVIIFGGEISATFMSIYNLFGPTFPGKYDATDKTYWLSYDGCCVKFPIPKQYEKLYQDQNALPLEFPNGSTPAATGFMVFVGSNPHEPQPPKPCKRYYFEQVDVTVGDGSVVLDFSSRNRQIQLGWSPQQVISEIGAPLSVFHKNSQANGAATRRGDLHRFDYFHNYPHLGMDLLYDIHHRVSKIILRTNAIGHPDFGEYLKCNFALYFALLPGETASKKPITAQTSWRSIQKLLGNSHESRPVIHDSGLGLHPFGSSLCYSPIPGCIFEVMANGFLASVTLTSALIRSQSAC